MATLTYYNGLAGDPVPAWLTPTIKNAIDTTQNQELANISTLDQRTGHYIKFYVNKGNISVFYFFFNSNTTVYLPADNTGVLDIAPSTTYGHQTTWYRRGSGEPVSFTRPWAAFPSDGVGLAISDATQIYIEEANVAFDMGGTPYDPNLHDEHIFTKDPGLYKMYAGIAAADNSTYENYYYSTLVYKLRLRWQSLRTGTSYTMPLDGRCVYQTAQVLTPTSIVPAPFYTFAYSTDNAAPYAHALRMPLGAFETSSDIPTAWADLTDLRAITEITLQDLVDFANTITAGCTVQDVFTEIFCDFMDVNNTVLDTKSCDYSSLFGDEDVDINGGTIHDPNDDPSIPDSVYTDHIDLTTPTLTGTGVFNRCYVLDANSVNDLCDFLYNASDSIFDEIIDGVLTRGNPIESLIDLRLYPFDVRAFTGAGTAESIKFGRTDTGVIGTKLPHNANAVISLGSAPVPRFYNSFLDYQMDCKLYIPFCGVCDLPIDRVLNHNISIKLIVDYITGACTAVVFADRIPIIYQPGVIGVSIPMTATNSAEFGKTIVGNLVTGAKAAMTGNISQLAEAGSDIASSLWEGSHIQSTGSSSPQTALFQPKNAYLLMSIVNPPGGVYDTTYDENIGYSCFMPMNQIGFLDGTGLCAFSDIKLNIPQATEAERVELLQLLEEGVFM